MKFRSVRCPLPGHAVPEENKVGKRFEVGERETKNVFSARTQAQLSHALKESDVRLRREWLDFVRCQ